MQHGSVQLSTGGENPASFSDRARETKRLQDSREQSARGGLLLLQSLLPPQSSSLQKLDQSLHQTKSLTAAFAALSQADQAAMRKQAGSKNLDEILAISQNPDAQLFLEEALAFGGRLEQAGKVENAAAVYSAIATPHPGPLPQGERGKFPSPLAGEGGRRPGEGDVRKQAQLRLNAITGKGHTGLRAEFLIGQFTEQATDWRVIAPMLAGSAVYGLARTTALSRLTTLGRPGARLGASAIGMAFEVPVFALGSRALARHSDPSRTVGDDLLGATFTLGALKMFGAGGAKLHEKAFGLHASPLQNLSRGLMTQGSVFAGLMASHRLEAAVGLRRKVDGATAATDTLSSMVALGVGAHLGHRVLGAKFARFQSELELRNRDLDSKPASSSWEKMLWGLKPAVASGSKLQGPLQMPMASLPEAKGGSVMMMEAKGSSSSASSARPLEGKYVLIGNRSEPAVRAVQEAKKLGAIPVVLHSDPDSQSLAPNLDGVIPLRLPGVKREETYLNIPLRLEVIERFMREHGIKPEQILAWEGWGFLSEDAGNTREYEQRGIKLAGASSFMMETMGDKIKAKAVATKAGVPIVHGSLGEVDLAGAQAFVVEHGLPVIIKGKDTGGGKGIRVVEQEKDLVSEFESAKREAGSTSSSSAVFIEKYIASMRHLELQVFGDGKGNFKIVGIRDCTMQRKKQKMVEEDVSTFLDPAIRAKAWAIGEKIMMQLKKEDPKKIGYEGPGTIELIWDQSDQQLYFMEMNTRLQVEHTVTEMVTGTNLLAHQLLVGSGKSLDELAPIREPQGHAIEVRITSDDPYNNFDASTGIIRVLNWPQGPKNGRGIVRVDSGIEAGREISLHYDSMIAKLIAWAPTRSEAIQVMRDALDQVEILGTKTNIPFLRELLATEEFARGSGYDTKFIEDKFLPSGKANPDYRHRQEAVIAAAIQTYLKNPGLNRKLELSFGDDVYQTEIFQFAPDRFWIRTGASMVEVGLKRNGDYIYNLEIDGQERRILIHGETGTREAFINGVNYEVAIEGEGALGDDYILAAAPSSIVKVLVKVGDEVKAGDPLLVTEAMKMENTVHAHFSGKVEKIDARVGKQVDKGKPLIQIRPAEGAVLAKPKKKKQEAHFSLKSAPLVGLAGISASQLPDHLRPQVWSWMQRYFEGFTVPVDLMKPALASLEPVPTLSEESAAKTKEQIQGLLERYQAVEALFQPAFSRPLQYFLKSHQVADPALEPVLKKAVALYGVDSLEPGPHLDAAIRRLYQSHDQVEAKQELLSLFLTWIHRYTLQDLQAPLAEILKIASDQHSHFMREVEETLALLRKKQAEADYRKGLEEEFQTAISNKRRERLSAAKKLLARSELILPYLLGQAGSSDRRVAQGALKLIQQRTYRNYFAFRGQFEHPTEALVVAKLDPIRGLAFPPALLIHVRPPTLDKLAWNLDLSFRQLKKARKKWGAHEHQWLEVMLPTQLTAENFEAIQKVLSEKLKGQGIERVTLIVEDPDGSDPDYRTFEFDFSGSLQENPLLRNIHPLHAQTIGLHRWTSKFDLMRMDFGLFHNVHAYRATQKDVGDPKKADRRHLVIGEHSSRLTYATFNGNRVRNQLISHFRELKKNPKAAIAGEARLIWQWLPYALRETGLIAKDFDPFTISVLSSSPAELIRQFQLDEAKLTAASAFYDRKVYSVPEAERAAAHTALVLKRLQETYLEDGEIKKLPALGDIFIRQAVDLSDEEIKLLAFRLTPNFMGQQLEKTTIHFKRRNPQSNQTEGFIAEIKIPRGTRFEVAIKRAMDDPPAHSVKTTLDHKIAGQQGRGQLYVYERIQLFGEVIKDFYPQGNLPAGAVQIRELVLDEKGGLAEIERPMGKNDISRVAFIVRARMPRGPESQEWVSREFAVIADDFTTVAGSNGPREGEIYAALARYAEGKGIPMLYMAETSGARLGLAEEVAPYVRYDMEQKVNYLHEADLGTAVGKKGKKLRELVLLGNPFSGEVEVKDGEKVLLLPEVRYPIRAIYGEGEINTESLNASGRTGEAQSRARSRIPTFTISFGTVVGIGTYDSRLSERVIMTANSFLGLTGYKAINNTFGTHFKNDLEVAGPEIMTENGVAYHVAQTEREALRTFLQWISYFPVKGAEEAVLNGNSDPIARELPAEILGGEIPLIKKNSAYDTRVLDRALFDRDSVFYLRQGYGRGVNTGYARLGGKALGLISMQLSPEQIPGGEEIFGGALDADGSFKAAQHIENLSVEGLPLVFIASISGFMPRPEDHRRGVVPGGAKILDALRVFPHAALIYVPPYGQLWGGAWVVIDKNINPNILMVADHSAAMGILGSGGAIAVPKNARAMETDLKKDPELTDLQKKIEGETDKGKKEKLARQYSEKAEELKASHYLPKWRAILDAQNTAERAYHAGTIHYLIEDTVKQTRPELHRLLLEKEAQIRASRDAEIQRAQQMRDIEAAMRLVGLDYRFKPEGGVEILWQGGRHEFPREHLLAGIQRLFEGKGYRLFMSILEASKPPTIPPFKPDED